ncbi:Uncharacterized protein PECH_006900 [Penicillium ucsense]|uniref:Uncharacterized protein n=1 Tax=Penicillium ucsense TaxID=2839758 RepID=A0A8J8W8M9_9EURO|nr:Uncharacterized protein PECM_004580 [Penicillium ucsense]KAF7738945.1 Uncharacterized protein PECH_006900 [Penicillium ucsense]
MSLASTSFSQFEGAKPPYTASFMRQASQYRPRTYRTRAVIFSAIIFFSALWYFAPSSKPSESDYWKEFPSDHPFSKRPEDAQVALPPKLGTAANESLPHDPEHVHPHLHLLVPTTKGTRGSCRTVTSAMILGYPPPTLIGYGHRKPGATELELTVDRITRIRDYLKNKRNVKDHDFVLIVDAQDTFFQLPPRILVERFQNIVRGNNERFKRKYGYAAVEKPDGSRPELIQKYSQRVLFGASKLCYHALKDDPGCVTVPESTLPPDVYGWKTDTHPDGHLNRPRWLNPGAVIGQAADLRIIYDEVLRLMAQRHTSHSDYQALTQMFGRQEVIRELERLRTVNKAKEWVYGLLGISDAMEIEAISVRLEAGHRYEYGIGVDYESQLFFNQILSRNDLEWIKFSNITTTSHLQGQFGVPREHRLLLPEDIAALPDPFDQTSPSTERSAAPSFNSTLDNISHTEQHLWSNVSLATNPHSASVPVLLHLNGDPKLRNAWWEKMWFFPSARALLRRYVRSAHDLDTAQSALLGGQDWWDMRGGRGGLWTDDENWVTISEVCQGQERDLFDDDLGPWGKENGDPDAPVYNQFGNLIKGKATEEEAAKKKKEKEEEREKKNKKKE